tara:strand:- start:3962 stop:4381 length:420 start_codon:yes stop_codon:yes gene_type:complete
MKKSELRLMVREIVREEVALSIKEVIAEIVKPSQSISEPQKKIVEKKHYSKNSVLNDVLNETAQDGDWKTLGGSEFTTERMNDIVGRNYNDISNSQPSSNIAAEMGVDPNDPANAFLTKDYRSVIKKVEEKDKQKFKGK